MAQSGSARDVGLPVVHFIRKTVNYNDVMPVLIGRIPAGAFLLQTYCRVEVAFTGTTPVLTVGTNAPTYNNIAAAADVTEGSLQTQVIATGAGLATATDLDVYATFSATTPTAGRATIVVGYCPGE